MGDKKPWTESEILELLDCQDKAVWRAVHCLYQFQTAEEKTAEQTKDHNNKGFNAVDAPFLTSLAKFYENHKRLTQRQTDAARKKVKKYVGQLLKVANGEIT
jgi:hypothetical protein